METNPSLGRPDHINVTQELCVADTPHIIPYRVRPRLNCVEKLCVFHTSRRLPERW